jgi:two-component system, cell cycle sensor histidine kinase and response regulator CckA
LATLSSAANIEEAARRAAELCQQMLAYARKKELRAKPMDLGELVRSTATLLRVAISRHARLEVQIDDALPPVFGDGTQLHQIVMNLVLNAADAIGERPGRIRVRVYSRDADTAFLRTSLQHPELPGGRYVVLEISDDGCGMSSEVLARIFEPFFTTKFTGRGLGLAAVFGIVQTHRGALFVESKVGTGSTFRLFLRAHSGTAETAPKEADAGPLFNGTALVVDDESTVREVLATVLRRVGMAPMKAATGDEALALYRDQGDSVDLVLLDVVMPGRSGEETLRMIRERNPRQRVLMMSGYTEDETMTRCRAAGATDFIAKPFDVAALIEKLRGALT